MYCTLYTVQSRVQGRMKEIKTLCLILLGQPSSLSSLYHFSFGSFLYSLFLPKCYFFLFLPFVSLPCHLSNLLLLLYPSLFSFLLTRLTSPFLIHLTFKFRLIPFSSHPFSYIHLTVLLRNLIPLSFHLIPLS